MGRHSSQSGIFGGIAHTERGRQAQDERKERQRTEKGENKLELRLQRTWPQERVHVGGGVQERICMYRRTGQIQRVPEPGKENARWKAGTYLETISVMQG